MPCTPVSTIVLDAGISYQQKTLLLRNPTNRDIIIKLDSNAPELSLSRMALVVPAKEAASVTAFFFVRERRGLPPILLYVYARPIYREAIPELKSWVASPIVCEKSSRLAFLLEVVVSSRLFSAPEIVLDLPGKATMIEPRNCVSQEDNDIATAKHITNKDLDYAVRMKRTERGDYCDLLRGLLDRIYPPA